MLIGDSQTTATRFTTAVSTISLWWGNADDSVSNAGFGFSFACLLQLAEPHPVVLVSVRGGDHKGMAASTAGTALLT